MATVRVRPGRRGAPRLTIAAAMTTVLLVSLPLAAPAAPSQVQADQPTGTTSWHARYPTTDGWKAHLAGDTDGDGREHPLSFHRTGHWWYATGEEEGGETSTAGTPAVTAGHLSGAECGRTTCSTSYATRYQTRSGWTGHALGDLSGNGHDDLLSFYDNRRWIRTTFDEQGRLSDRDDFTTYKDTTGWDGHVTGDVTGDGRDELLGYHAGAGHWVATTGDNERHVVTTYRTAEGWQAHLAADITDSGRVDLLSFHDNGRWYISSWDEQAGTYTTSRFTTYATTDGWDEHVAADITGDGVDELLSYHPSNGQWFATNADGDRWRYARYATTGGWQAHVAGDVDGDGRDDLLSYHPSNGTWWATTSTP